MLEKILDVSAHLLSDNRILFSAASFVITGFFVFSSYVDFITKRKDD